MGLSDRLKDLKEKAEGAVVEHNEQIHKAVEKVATAADQRTAGKYHERIQSAGVKASGLLDGIAGTDKQAQSGDAEGASEGTVGDPPSE